MTDTVEAPDSITVTPAEEPRVVTPMDDWKPTHTLSDNQVEVVVHSAMNAKTGTPQSYRDRQGRVYFLKAGRSAVPVPRERHFSEKVPDIELAYREGVYKGLRLAGITDNDELDRMVEEGGTPGRKFSNMRLFRTHHLATAFYAILGGHGHVGVSVDGNGGQSDYCGKDDDGNYIVEALIYDWQEKRHRSYRLKIPPRMWVEVVEKPNA